MSDIVISPLREYRVSIGMTAEQFAEKLGVNKLHLQAIEIGRNPAGIRFVENLAIKCGLSLADAVKLCGRSATKKAKPKAKKVVTDA